MICEFCEHEIRSGLLVCPHCGRLPRSKAERRLHMIGILICIGLACAATAIISVINGVTPHFQ